MFLLLLGVDELIRWEFNAQTEPSTKLFNFEELVIKFLKIVEIWCRLRGNYEISFLPQQNNPVR